MKSVSRTGWAALVLGLGTAAAAAASLAGCSGKPAAGPARPSHSAMVPAPALAKGPSPPPPADGFVGVVLAREAVNVSAESEGRLASVDVRVGDSVTRGARIAALVTENLIQDRAMADASVKSAQAEMRRTEVQLQRAKEQAARRQALSDVFSKEEVAAAQSEQAVAAAALDASRAQVSQQNARLRQLDTQIARSVLRSPIDGRVAVRYYDPGALVTPGTPVIRLIASQSFLVRFAVPPEKAGALAVGQTVEMKLDASGSGLVVPARITQIAPQIDPASQMVFVEATPAAPADVQARLQDGLAGRVTVAKAG